MDPLDAFNEDLPDIHDFTLISSEAKQFSEEEEEKEKVDDCSYLFDFYVTM